MIPQQFKIFSIWLKHIAFVSQRENRAKLDKWVERKRDRDQVWKDKKSDKRVFLDVRRDGGMRS